MRGTFHKNRDDTIAYSKVQTRPVGLKWTVLNHNDGYRLEITSY